MRIIIATPLYPPEVADAAAYAKELARRLVEHHQVTIVTYARLPEEVSGARVVAIDKRQPRFARLTQFRKALACEARSADVIIAINGASVELPVLFGLSAPVVFCVADTAAHARGGFLERLAFTRARAIIRDVPPRKPETLPSTIAPRPTEALADWEHIWETHLEKLNFSFSHD